MQRRGRVLIAGLIVASALSVALMLVGVFYSTFTPTCTGVAATDTATFNVLISSITTAGRTGTLKVPYTTTRCQVNNLTIPAGVTLDFSSNSTGIEVAPGQTLTIVGGVLAPPGKQVLFNATSGQGTVSFSGNAVQKDLYVAWWGADVSAVGADTNAAINAALVAVPDGATLRFSRGKTYQVTGLTWSGKFAASLIGVDTGTSPQDSGSAPTISYAGVDGGTVLRGVNLYKCMIKGIRFVGSAAGGSAGADAGVWLDQDAGISSPPISTQDLITGNVFTPNSNRSGWKGLKIDNASAANNEQHVVSHNLFQGTTAGGVVSPNQLGVGVYLGHVNVKQVIFQRNTFFHLAKGIQAVGASYRALNNIHSQSHTAYYGPTSDTTVIEGDDIEGVLALFHVPDGFNAIARITGVRAGDVRVSQGSTVSVPFINAPSGSLLVVEDNVFGTDSSNFGNKIVYDSTGTSSIRWQLNRSANIAKADMIAALDTFAFSLDDVRGNGENGDLIPGGLSVKGAFGFIRNSNALSGATPDVAAGNPSTRYSFNNGGTPTTVTNFLNGFDGQLIIVKGDTVTSIANGASIKTSSGATIAPWSSSKIVTFLNQSGVWQQQSGVADTLTQGEGAVLSISSNTITPTSSIHHVGAGLIKTITVPSGFTSGVLQVIPDSAYTYDATGNILVPSGGGTAVVNKLMTFTYSSSSSKWIPSY